VNQPDIMSSGDALDLVERLLEADTGPGVHAASPHKASPCVGLSIVASLVALGLVNNIIAKSLMSDDKIDSFLLIFFNLIWDMFGFALAACIRNCKRGQSSADRGSSARERGRVRWIGLGMMLLYQGGNWLYFKGLSEAGVSLTAILYQLSTVFVFLFSLLFLKEAVHPFKILAVCFCVAGVMLVAVDNWSEADSGGDNHFGVLALLLSAMLWGLYEVFLGVMMPNSSIELVNVYVGWRGAWNLILLWPVAIGVCMADPSAWEAVLALTSGGLLRVCAMAVVSVLTTCILTLGISWTTPVYMRLGGTLNSPAAILWEIFTGHSPGWKCYVGIILTILGFLFCNISWKFDQCSVMTTGALTPVFMLPPPSTGLTEKDSSERQPSIN
jgi:drug/metabolite transporter (DMT)-like permease